MTHEQWKNLTDHGKNSRIATLIGGVFKPCECSECMKDPDIMEDNNNFSRVKRWHWSDGSITDDWDLPDYIHDLNAMHKAEKTIPPEKIIDYMANMSKLLPITEDRGNSQKPEGWLWHMTAEQRAEAFVITMEEKA